MFNFCSKIRVCSIVYTISGEMLTSILRQKTLAIAISISAAANTFCWFVSPYIFNPDYGNLNAKIGLVFGAHIIIFFVFDFLYVPKTRLPTYEELDELFTNHVPARNFTGHVTVAEQRATEAFEVAKTKGADYEMT